MAARIVPFGLYAVFLLMGRMAGAGYRVAASVGRYYSPMALPDQDTGRCRCTGLVLASVR